MSRLTRRGVLSGGFSALSASLSPTSLSGTGTGASVTTSGSVTIAVTGGSGSYAYAWERVSGSTGISASSPALATTSFTATGLIESETRAAVWRGAVTDTVTGAVVHTANTVSVELTRSAAALSAFLDPSSLSGSSTGGVVTTSGSVTVYASGGSGAYAYAWERVSGSSVPSANSPSSVSTGFTTSSIAAGATQSTTWRCVVTDTVSLATTVTGSVSISLSRDYAALSVSVAPSSLSGTGNTATVVTSGSATASVSGGSGSWTGAWEWDGGSSTGSIVPSSSGNATTTFRSGDAQSQGTTRSAGFRFRVTDTMSGQAAVSGSVNVTLTRYAALSASASPGSLSGTGSNTPVVTSGAATCTASGGSGAYAYSWEWDQGPSTGSIVPSTHNVASTTFRSGDAQAPGTTRSASFLCRVTDTVTSQSVTTGTVAVTLTRQASGISYAEVSPAIQNWPATSPFDAFVIALHDGVGPFTYNWSASPSLGITIASPSSQSTSVSSVSGKNNVTMTCRVTDNGSGGAFIDASGTIQDGFS